MYKLFRFFVFLFIGCMGLVNVMQASDEPAQLDLILTGTIVQKDAAKSVALIKVDGNETEQSFSVDDQINAEIKLLEIEQQRVVVEHQDQKYWIVFNSQDQSDIISYMAYNGIAAVNRLDSAEFYNQDGILMEGAAALRYGVNIDAEPVVEELDLDTRLENLPEGTKMRNGIPATWWNPQNLSYDAEQDQTTTVDASSDDAQVQRQGLPKQTETQ